MQVFGKTALSGGNFLNLILSRSTIRFLYLPIINESNKMNIDSSKLKGVEKVIAERFFEQTPNPICIVTNCAENAKYFSFVVKNRKDSEFLEVRINTYCNFHNGIKIGEKFLN